MPSMPLAALAPDQRAVVQLVLQRERSYAQIAELLNISEDAVRARAHAGLAALAPDVELPAEKVAQIADFLLGQQNGKPRQATRRMLRSSGGARAWAETVRAELEDLGGALPDLPAPAASAPAAPAVASPEVAPSPEPEAGSPEPADAPPAPRPRPLREPRPRTRPVAATEGAQGAAAASSSRLGGAILIGGGVLAVVAVVLFLFVFGGDDDGDNPDSASATATPTASATPQPVGEIALKGVNEGAKAQGVMRLYLTQGKLAFTLEGSGVPRNRSKEAYGVWFTTPGGGAQRVIFAEPVGANGQLGTVGPATDDLDKFPRWLARYRQVVVARETKENAERPGPIVLRGALPRS